MKLEYRVRWRRGWSGDGPPRRAVVKVFQTRRGAVALVDRLLALEEVKDELPQYADMPNFLDEPTIEQREVGEWHPHPGQVTEASRETRSEFRAHVHHAHDDETRHSPVAFARAVSPVADQPEDIPF